MEVLLYKNHTPIPKRPRGNMTVEKVLSLQRTLLTDDKIGKEFGITRQAVYLFRKINGIPPVKNKHQSRNEQIYHLWKAKTQAGFIMSQFGIKLSTFYRIIKQEIKKENGIPNERPLP